MKTHLRQGARWLLVLSMILLLGSLVVFSRQSQTPRKYPQRQPVVFWHMWTAEWAKVVNRIAERFNQSQDQYEVIPVSLPPGMAGFETDRKFFLAVVGGDPPDCMAQWNPVIPLWANEGLLEPLDKVMSPAEYQDALARLYPAARNIGSYNGKLYGVATALNAFALFCRLDHLREAGLTPEQIPPTIEEFLPFARKLDRFDHEGNILRLGYHDQYGGFTWPFWIARFGGSLYDWTQQRVTVSSPANLRALDWFQVNTKFYGQERMLRFASVLQMTSNMGGLDWSFLTGHFSLVLDGPWRVEQLAKFAPDLEYCTVPAPYPREGGRSHGGWTNGNFIVIPKGSKNPKGALAFMRYWSGLDDPTVAAEFMAWGGWVPPVRGTVEAPAYQAYIKKYPQFATFVRDVDSPDIQVSPPVAYLNYFFDRYLIVADSVTRMRLTPEEGLAQLTRDVAIQEQKLAERRHQETK